MVQEEFGSFNSYIWRFVGGQPIQNRHKTMKDVPATSTESDALSKDLKERGFKFVGSTIIYAHMQAAGLVNDHLVRCFRYRHCAALAAITHKFGVSVDFLRKFKAESVFRCDYKASKLVEPNRDEARAPSGNSSARRGLYICVGAGSQGTVRWDTDGASVMRRAFVRDKTMPGAPRCDEKFPEPGHRF